MTRAEKISAIYKEMANKKLTPWCYVRIEPPYNGYGTFLYRLRGDESKKEIKEIIWHPVMIGTILEWYSSSRWFINSQFITKLIDKRTWYDESIDEQSDGCIDFVYSLIPSISME